MAVGVDTCILCRRRRRRGGRRTERHFQAVVRKTTCMRSVTCLGTCLGWLVHIAKIDGNNQHDPPAKRRNCCYRGTAPEEAFLPRGPQPGEQQQGIRERRLSIYESYDLVLVKTEKPGRAPSAELGPTSPPRLLPTPPMALQIQLYQQQRRWRHVIPRPVEVLFPSLIAPVQRRNRGTAEKEARATPSTAAVA